MKWRLACVLAGLLCTALPEGTALAECSTVEDVVRLFERYDRSFSGHAPRTRKTSGRS